MFLQPLCLERGTFFQSLFGFGGSFIIILGLSLLVPVQSVIGMLPFSLILGAGVVVVRDAGDARWKTIFKMFFISSPAVIGGAVFLNYLNSRILMIVICLLIFIYCLYSFFIERIELPGFIHIPYLLISGFIIGATGVGMLFVPLVIQKIRKPAELRVSLHLLWVLLGLLRTPFYIGGGIITFRYAIMGFSVIPVVLFGQYWGKKVHSKMAPEAYHRGLLIALGAAVIVRLGYEMTLLLSIR